MGALALLASCSSEEEVKAPATGAIEFGNLFVNNATRATDITLENLQDFKVYGFMGDPTGVVFDGETVSKGTTGWTYTNLQYWTANKNYWFSGIAPATGANWTFAPITEATTSGDYTGGGVLTFNNQAANGNQDLIYAWSGKVECATPSTMQKVGLTFNHLLSRVMFTFQNDLKNSNTSIVVRKVNITNAYANGTIDLTKAPLAWTVENPTLSLLFSDIQGNIAVNSKATTGTNYLIPTTFGYNLTFTVDLYQGKVLADTYEHTVTMPAVAMQPGYSYNFVAKLNAQNINPEEELYPIEFTVTAVNGFTTQADSELNVTPVPTPEQ